MDSVPHPAEGAAVGRGVRPRRPSAVRHLPPVSFRSTRSLPSTCSARSIRSIRSTRSFRSIPSFRLLRFPVSPSCPSPLVPFGVSLRPPSLLVLRAWGRNKGCESTVCDVLIFRCRQALAPKGERAGRPPMRGWRNRQTRWIQVPVPERAWGFNSPSRTRRKPRRSSTYGAFACVSRNVSLPTSGPGRGRGRGRGVGPGAGVQGGPEVATFVVAGRDERRTSAGGVAA